MRMQPGTNFKYGSPDEDPWLELLLKNLKSNKWCFLENRSLVASTPTAASSHLFTFVVYQDERPNYVRTPILRNVPPKDKMSRLSSSAAGNYMETEGSHSIISVNIKPLSQQSR